MSRSIKQNRIMQGAAIDHDDSRYPLFLLGLFVLWWSWLAWKPHYREDWLLENVMVFIAVPLLIGYHRSLRFSNRAYTLLFVFFCLHEVGAHYTYSAVPYRAWGLNIFGVDWYALVGSERNHYDRLVHFLYGFLLLPVAVEILDARAHLTRIWRLLVPVGFIMSHSELFEIIEWQAAEIFGGPLGQAYLGSQGDIWDAQKDSAAAALGAILSMCIVQAAGWRQGHHGHSTKSDAQSTPVQENNSAT